MSLLSILYITSTGTLDNTSTTFLIDASSGDITFTLSNINADGENYGIERVDSSANTVTLVGYDTSQTINGSTSKTMAPGDTFMLVSFNNTWYTIL